MGRKDRVRPEPDREPRAQYAALPWRRTKDGQVEVLLITSRETRRWVIPKGWPILGLKSPKSAAREAREEAGVSGRIGKTKLGVYHYDKRLASGRIQHVRVTVYPLEVEKEAADWQERGEREKQWTTPAQAAQQVEEPELQALIAAFSPS